MYQIACHFRFDSDHDVGAPSVTYCKVGMGGFMVTDLWPSSCRLRFPFCRHMLGVWHFVVESKREEPTWLSRSLGCSPCHVS